MGGLCYPYKLYQWAIPDINKDTPLWKTKLIGIGGISYKYPITVRG